MKERPGFCRNTTKYFVHGSMVEIRERVVDLLLVMYASGWILAVVRYEEDYRGRERGRVACFVAVREDNSALPNFGIC